MIHGGLGYVDGGSIHLPASLLRPLAIRHQTGIFGIYYPTKYDFTSVQHDFMITPIPYRLWPRIGRYTIRLKHQAGAIRAITDLLASHEVSILFSEIARSGYRFGTWDLTVTFDSLQEIEELSYQAKKSAHKETLKKIAEIKNVIRDECNEFLFEDPDDLHLKEPVIEVPHTTLSYFYQESLQASAPNRAQAWLHRPFRMRYDAEEDAIVSGDEETLQAILDYTSRAEEHEGRWYVFASADTHDMTIRMALIPPGAVDNFFEATFEYTRSGDPDSSRGILAHVLTRLPREFNIWRLINHTRVNAPHRERGSLTFLVEDPSSSPNDASFSHVIHQAVSETHGDRRKCYDCSDLNNSHQHKGRPPWVKLSIARSA